MKQKFHYATITEAIEQLKSQGFNLELSLENSHFKADGAIYMAEEFEIVDLYRYEGHSDPADEATVYALTSTSGLKGILVTGYGATANDEQAEETIKHLHYKYLQNQQQ